MASKQFSNFAQFLLIFALLYIGSQVFLKTFFPAQFDPESIPTGIELKFEDATVKYGHHPVLVLGNYTDQVIEFADNCPQPPVAVYYLLNDERQLLTAADTVLPCEPLDQLAAGQKTKIDLAPWKYSLFEAFGTYEVEFPTNLSSEPVTARFELKEVGVFTKTFRTFISKPLLNLLIFIASLFSDYSLGWAVVILTVLVKIVLFFPTQHAMEGQRKMQAVQPQLDELRKKFKDNPERMNKEVMALWKKEGVNPMQSCLPMLIQFPVLIGLFFVIRDGSVLEISNHLVYDMFADIDWSFGPDFFGMNLLVPSWYVMPPLLVVMQFIQLKLSFAIANKKKAKTNADANKPKEKLSQQAMQQRMMLYGLPLMIGVFAFQFPAAVSLYWAVSTIFAIGQQLYVNRKEI